MGIRPSPSQKRRDVNDRNLIWAQWWIGLGLVVFGALLFVIYHWAGIFPSTSGSSGGGGSGDNTLGYIATAIVGAGVAILPTTAAGSAGARILQGLSRSALIATTGTAVADAAPAKTYTLNGSIGGAGTNAHYYFEFGGDTSYGNATTPTSLPESDAAQVVQATGVQMAAGDHYRLVAHDDDGSAYGEDATAP